MSVSLKTRHIASSRKEKCYRCKKYTERNSLWFTEVGWMCNNCFTEYINMPENAKKKIFKRKDSI